MLNVGCVLLVVEHCLLDDDGMPALRPKLAQIEFTRCTLHNPSDQHNHQNS